MNTIEASRLAIAANNQQINDLLRQTPVDHLAIQQLTADNTRLLRVIRSAQNITSAAPRASRIDKVLEQFVPRAFAHR